MAYSLLTYPDNLLKVDHSQCIVDHKDKSLKSVFETMETEMKKKNGIGISAIQIGIPLPLCIVGSERMINPKIVSCSMSEDYMVEGCLSCPDVQLAVRRPNEVTINYTKPDGTKVNKLKLSGLKARCVQHELDHMHGILIKDRV